VPKDLFPFFLYAVIPPALTKEGNPARAVCAMAVRDLLLPLGCGVPCRNGMPRRAFLFRSKVCLNVILERTAMATFVETVLPPETRPPARLYHYTSQSGLLGILKSKTLWATRIQYLSDASEFRYTLKLWAEATQERQQLVTASDAGNSDLRSELTSILGGLLRIPVHVACFSEDGDSLDLWRAYCRSGPGFSIGFDSHQLIAAAINCPCFLAPCIYDPSRQSKLVDKLMGPFLARDFTDPKVDPKEECTNLIHDYLFLSSVLKDPAFSSEKEWRLVTREVTDEHPLLSVREGRNVPVPYFPVDLPASDRKLDLDIVVGPTPYSELAVESVNTLLKKFACTGSARRSLVPYREI